MSDIAERLLARLDEIQELAERAADVGIANWKPEDPSFWFDDETPMRDYEKQLIAMHDPAAVLRRSAADREIVQDWLDNTNDPNEGLTEDQLHFRHGHSCFQYATTTGPRKAWEHSMEPPRNDAGEIEEGWELNRTERDPDAFERFAYSEERYWRRRVKPGPHVWERWVPNHIKLLARGYGLEAL